MKQITYPYQNPNLSIEERVANLLSLMTLEEKIAQIGSYWIYELLDNQSFDRSKAQQKLAHGIGQITRLAGASSLDPIGCAKLSNELQRFLVEQTRLGIPALIHEECCSGYTARNATAFPQIIGLASSWQPELAEAMTGEIRKQMRAVGAHQGLSPILDIGRDPRWGRIEETFGEDPTLIAAMGVAYIRGLQGENLSQGVISTVKHFVGYSVTEGGLNWAPAHIAERELHEIYLHPFEAAVKVAKVRALMAGYHELDGIPVSSSKWLMSDLIRGEWGFDGVVVSDYMSINSLYNYHEYARDKAEASQMSLTAGVDVELPTSDCYAQPMLDAVHHGQIDEALIDQSVRRHLHLKFELGLFENPYVNVDRVASVFDTASQRQLAYTISQKSLVLLKNEGNLLPLPKSLRSVAVIGPNANNLRNLVGDYSYPAHIEILVAMNGAGLSETPLPESVQLRRQLC
ncbi:MAG: glycoside hydrolase family 3 protein [Caldilineaceae bacterium]